MRDKGLPFTQLPSATAIKKFEDCIDHKKKFNLQWPYVKSNIDFLKR